VRVIEPARDRYRDNDGKRVRFERSGGHCILHPSLKSAGPIPRQAPPGLHCCENKVLSCTAATTGTRNIFSVSMSVFNSVFAMQVAFFAQNVVHSLFLLCGRKIRAQRRTACGS